MFLPPSADIYYWLTPVTAIALALLLIQLAFTASLRWRLIP